MSFHSLPSVVDKESGLGFGCMSITAFYGDPMNDDDALALLGTVYDSGIRHFDTAEIYKTGNIMTENDGDIFNETIVGKFLQTKPRDSYTIATKYMPFKHGDANYDTVKYALEGSLKRLGLDHVDIYYSHRVKSLEDIIEFGKAAAKLKEEGFIKHVGISEISGAWLEQVHAVCPISVVQQEWSLLTRNLVEDELVPMCSKLGVTIVAYSPLSRNLLGMTANAKPPQDWRAKLPRFKAEVYEKNAKLVSDIVGPISAKYDCTAAGLSLAWLFAKAKQLNVKVVPIPGTTKIKNAQANAQAVQVNISDENDIEQLDTLSSKVEGMRGDEGYVSVGIEAQTK